MSDLRHRRRVEATLKALERVQRQFSELRGYVTSRHLNRIAAALTILDEVGEEVFSAYGGLVTPVEEDGFSYDLGPCERCHGHATTTDEPCVGCGGCGQMKFIRLTRRKDAPTLPDKGILPGFD